MTIIETRKAALMARVKEYGGPLNEPAVLAQFLAQVMHESGGLRYVREIWRPTKAQKGYEGRKDLGNTHPGDGKKFMGRDVIQVTGRANYRALSKWAGVDFVSDPEALERPEWLGIGAIWYFLAARPKLVQYCRDGNIEMVTRQVNGGLNGYQDRLRWYDRIALELLGVNDVRVFQKAMGLVVDGISGPKTRAAMHEALSHVSETAKTEHEPRVMSKKPTVSEIGAEAPKRPVERKSAPKVSTPAKDAAGGLLGGLTAGALILYAAATDAIHKAVEFYHWLTPWN